MLSRFISAFAALLVSVSAFAQEASATWKVEAQKVAEETFRVSFTGTIAPGQHIYGVAPEMGMPFEVNYASDITAGPISEESTPTDYNGEPVFFHNAVFSQEVTAPEGTQLQGTLSWQACTEDMCGFPEEYEFSVALGKADAHSSVIGDPEKQSDGNLWALLLEAILWGLAMLLTPCVFPMVPMTVSFFLKASDNVHQGRFKAFMYGVFIVLLYTVPVVLLFGLTRLIGGETVTADIFNWLATHWLPNILFFLVFFVFALSFFGAFEITLPSSWSTSADAKSGKGGLAGVFFMALTLVLVSFSCTGPIVGSVLLKSTQGQFWTPMVTMLAFSVAFALPFTVFALFPQLLKKLKSGSWLNSVKVVLGFIELALGLKFLSTADQTYHWHILDREVYLALWIVIFTLLGLYLLGKIRFKYDEPRDHVSIVRLLLSIGVFSFVVYLVPGMWGAPLKGISGFLPPLESQDFVMGSPATSAPRGSSQSRYDLKMPLGLVGYFSVEEGLEAAKRERKPLFVDITGHGCVNCREMEQRVWSDERVLSLLRERFVLVALYMDDKTRLDEDEWITTESGKVLKDLGRVNSYTARTLFGVNAQPNYVILGLNGEALSPVRGYNLNIEEYIDFLHGGLEAFDRAYHKL